MEIQNVIAWALAAVLLGAVVYLVATSRRQRETLRQEAMAARESTERVASSLALEQHQRQLEDFDAEQEAVHLQEGRAYVRRHRNPKKGESK